MEKRSRSSSAARYPDPYHAVSEVYTKEVTHKPIGPVSEFPPEILEILREEPRASPPLVRSRENTWTPENFPIVKVPSAQFTDIMTELYDYHEVEKYTRRSVTPDFDRRQPTEAKIQPPTYQVIPPTPEKNTPRHGIPLTSSDTKKPLPMYEEYVKMQKDQENRNPLAQRIPDENQDNNNDNLRHIDSSSSSESLEIAKNLDKRYVYSHDVYVDSTTGRPFTPGREDVEGKKNCDKLKINVYFKPPHPPVEITYQLDEIEIEKQEEISKLRPFGTILSRAPLENSSVLPFSSEPEKIASSEPMDHRRIPTRTSVLRKEHEILTVPLARNFGGRQSRISEHSARRSASKSITEASINMDDVFPKMPHHHANISIDKGDYPHRRVPSVISSHKGSQGVDRNAERSPSFHSHAPSHKSERNTNRSPSYHAPSHKSERTPSEVRIPVTVTRTTQQQAKRQSPEELDYGRFENGNEKIAKLPYTRGVSKTPSDKGYGNGTVTRNYSNPDKGYSNPEARNYSNPDKGYSNPDKKYSIPVVHNYSNPDKTYSNPVAPAKSVASARSSYRSQQTNKSLTPELPYTRGISKTPSDVHIPYNNPDKEKAYQQARYSNPSQPEPKGSAKSRPTAPGPIEEIVHIKERYERDETIRRFFPTTTTV